MTLETSNAPEEVQSKHNDVDSAKTILPIKPGIYYPRNRVHRQKSQRLKTKRVVQRNGEFNIERCKTNGNGKFSLFSTWFMTLVESRWRWTLFNFCAAFTANWLLFAFIHWTIAICHGDLTQEHLPHNQNSSQWTPCVKNINGFTSTFLFSVEVHTTVAYGRRTITLECPQTIITMCLQCMVSSIFQAFWVGILFAKLTRPKSRTQIILFSKQLTVTLRNDKLCLIFRVGDVRASRILNIKASMFVVKCSIRDDMTEDFEQFTLEVEFDGCESTFFLWPVSVIHVIDEKSPLYNISAADMLCDEMEILAVFEGLIESTGQPVQARTSYTSKDILWGHRFVPIVTNDVTRTFYDVDFSKLSETVPVDTPLCSSMEYDSITSIANDKMCKINPNDGINP